MFKNTHTYTDAYIEAPQPNPLHWQLYYKDGDVFHSQTHTIKCRDFFNDVVAKRNEVVFDIYRFTTKDLKFNDEGLYVLLTNVDKMWEKNILAVVSPEMEKAWGKPLQYSVHKQGTLILIPNEALESTYTMSLLTLLIRYCNYGIELTSLEDCFKPGGVTATDHAVADPIRFKAILKYRFNRPAESKDYWWYFNAQYNNKDATTGNYSGTIHNNGVANWLTNFLKGV